MDSYASEELDPVFQTIVNGWKARIEKAKAHKREVFGKAAHEAYQFYCGPRSWDELMMSGTSDGMGAEDSRFPDPTFKMSVNKTFEFVSIFGPALYYENPVRTVKPRQPVEVPPEFFQDQAMYQQLATFEQDRLLTDTLRAQVLGSYLNWTPNQGLSDSTRLAINEALIKGRGCLWTELYEPPAAQFRVVRSVYDSVDNLLVDPDAPHINSAQWIARQHVKPVWWVERHFGMRPGSLRGNMESQAKQADIEVDEDQGYNRRRGLTNDLLVYWEVFSKMGIGGRLQGADPNVRPSLEVFGDYCRIVVANTCPFPLNLSPDVTSDPRFGGDPEIVFGRTVWPTPYWGADFLGSDGWPVSVLDFHEVHQCPWPLAPIKAAIGELKFLNWVMSFLTAKLHTSCRDLIAIRKSLSEEIKNTLLHGKDLELLELEAEHGTISELVQVLQIPPVNGDIWKMIAAVENNFDKRMGLTELMYGTEGSTQIRSAEEANIRSQGMNVRPQDMGKQVEAWQAEVAMKEAVASRYHLVGNDVKSVLGPTAAIAWQEYVHSKDIVEICYGLEYHIEAGSTQRPNKMAEVRQMTEAMQAVAPILQQYAQLTGDIVPLNNMLADFAKSRDLDPARYQLTAPIPPPVPSPSPEPHAEQKEPTSATVPTG
jgi:hypothetical protein